MRQHPKTCPSCGNENLARYSDVSRCNVCAWSNEDKPAAEIEAQPTRAALWLRWFLRLYVHFFVRASLKEKCPACGHRAKHGIEWQREVQALFHECAVCHAFWKEPPILNAQSWNIGADEVARQTPPQQRTEAPRARG